LRRKLGDGVLGVAANGDGQAELGSDQLGDERDA
jgi:hypothetical protein